MGKWIKIAISAVVMIIVLATFFYSSGIDYSQPASSYDYASYDDANPFSRSLHNYF